MAVRKVLFVIDNGDFVKRFGPNVDENAVFVKHPLDERYFVEPTDETIGHAVEVGPPEEKEVHDMLLAVSESQAQLSFLDTLCSQLFFWPTRRYVEYLDKWGSLKALAVKSPEHRAAFCRMSNNQYLGEDLRKDLRQIVSEVF